MNHLTMQQLEVLGFEIVKSYTHNEFMTQRRQKGNITVETTWRQTGEFESQDLFIDADFIEFEPNELKILDKILNK